MTEERNALTDLFAACWDAWCLTLSEIGINCGLNG